MKKLFYLSLSLVYSFILTVIISCQPAKDIQLVYPEQRHSRTVWTEEELSRDIAVRNLLATEYSSSHIIRLKVNEPRHYHDYHDLSITVMEGGCRINFKDSFVNLSEGDAVFIPRGTLHWAGARGHGACIVHAVFSPPFDGLDRRIESGTQ